MSIIASLSDSIDLVNTHSPRTRTPLASRHLTVKLPRDAVATARDGDRDRSASVSLARDGDGARENVEHRLVTSASCSLSGATPVFVASGRLLALHSYGHDARMRRICSSIGTTGADVSVRCEMWCVRVIDGTSDSRDAITSGVV